MQDAHLSIAPEASFFKRSYKRVSNYAVETLDLDIPSIAWGKNFNVIISRNGDLATEMWMVMDIELTQLADTSEGADSVHWTNVLGHAMFQQNVALEIGTNEIDFVTGAYMEILHELQSDVNVNVDELVLRSSSEAQLIEWTNNGNTLDTNGAAIVQMWVCLPFWFTHARSQALPIIALQYHDIRVKFTLRKQSDLLVYSNASNKTLHSTYNGVISKASIAVNFVFLDSMERRLFAASVSEYLVKNLQVSDFNTKPSGTTKVETRLTFNHPVTSLYWFVQKKSHLTNLDYFNYERTDGLGDDTITTATIKFNGTERERARGPLYFRCVQPSVYFKRTPRRPIYAYSFAQHPSAWWPSGSCNFSRIDVTALAFTFVATDAYGDAFGEADITVMATSFNVIRIQGGMTAKKSFLADISIFMRLTISCPIGKSATLENSREIVGFEKHHASGICALPEGNPFVRTVAVAA